MNIYLIACIIIAAIIVICAIILLASSICSAKFTALINKVKRVEYDDWAPKKGK